VTDLFVAVPGGRLYVVDEGDPNDPPIVLLHAGIADLRSWDALAPLLIGAGYRAIRFDRRGFGRTETEDVEFRDAADAIEVLDALRVGRAALVGNSMGGMTAFDAAIEHPRRVVAVVGVGAGLGGFAGQETPAELAAWEVMAAVDRLTESATGEEHARLIRELAELETAFWMDGPVQAPGRVAAVLRDALTEMNVAHMTEGRPQGRPVRMTPPAAERLGDLRCPVLAIAGALDAVEVSQAAEFIAANAPDARAVLLPNVAHMIGMEAPDTLAGLIARFLAPLPRWS
jgi:pimeloyl-ACP methyl ester carboxylesterase